MSKSISAKRFCEIYSQFWGDKIISPEGLIKQTFNGKELHKFCEFYHKEKLDESSLQHFYSCRKRKYVFVGICIGIILCSIIQFKSC